GRLLTPAATCEGSGVNVADVGERLEIGARPHWKPLICGSSVHSTRDAPSIAETQDFTWGLPGTLARRGVWVGTWGPHQESKNSLPESSISADAGTAEAFRDWGLRSRDLIPWTAQRGFHLRVAGDVQGCPIVEPLYQCFLRLSLT